MPTLLHSHLLFCLPSFDELMSFAEQLENEFNEWVKNS